MKRLPYIAMLLAGCAAHLADPEPFEDPEYCNVSAVPEQIFAHRCATVEGCHVPHSAAGSIEYLSADLGARLLGTEATTCANRFLIDPSDPSASFILTRISPDPQCDGMAIDRMPKVGVPLTDHEIECVRQWVEAVATGEAP